MVTTTHECHAPTYVCHVACGVQLEIQEIQDPVALTHRPESPYIPHPFPWPKRRIPIHEVAMLKLSFLPRRCQLNCKTPLQPQLKFFVWVCGILKGYRIERRYRESARRYRGFWWVRGGSSSLSQKLDCSLTYEMRGMVWYGMVSLCWFVGLMIRFTLL